MHDNHSIVKEEDEIKCAIGKRDVTVVEEAPPDIAPQ
jgi:hypothetical protein